MADAELQVNRDIIGMKIKDALHAYSRTPSWLAEQTGIGVRTIYSILNGHHLASPEKLRRICEVLHISLDTLLDLEVNAFPIFPRPYEESRTYASFESIWFGSGGGERISVSRGFSIANQSEALRENILRKIFGFKKKQLQLAMRSFIERQQVIRKKERSRLEIVVDSEIADFVHRRAPWDAVSADLIFECVEDVIARLINDPLRFEVVVIPRQYFLVNYEIINREVILFDLGTVFLRQTHPRILDHFLNEVADYKSKRAVYSERDTVVHYLTSLVQQARDGSS